jgi:twitching motility protein PilT
MTKRLTPDPDIEDLIRSLNQSAKGEESGDETAPEDDGDDPRPQADSAPRWPLGARSDDASSWLIDLLGRAREAHASDLLLVADSPPVVRVNGALRPLGEKALSEGSASMLCAALVPSQLRADIESRGSADFSFSRPGLGRFRCNVHRERGRWAASIRVFPDSSPELEKLNLPPVLGRLAELEHGLVLVTGPTGCGKSTTLAALIRRLLSHRPVHLITIEDPTEYEHAHGDSVIEHIEIGRDAPSFAHALRAALRQDPDVLLIGEMRDPESISIAITAAETGHLVLSTLHTGDAPQTINRILDSYPANQIENVRVQLSISLAAIVSQQLLPKIDGKGRVPAAEVLFATPAVRNLVRKGKIEQLRSQFTLEQKAGNLSFDQSLVALVLQKLVTEEEARFRSRALPEFDALMDKGRRGLN